jgi:hypothetical protein
MDWMEVEPGSELNLVQPRPVDPNRADALFQRLQKLNLPLVSNTLLGIHETSFQFKVFSGASFCEFNWWHTLPSEWRSLEEAVSEVQAIAEEALRVA